MEYYNKIPAHVVKELQQLHRATLPADDVPSFRRESTALGRVDGTVVAYVTWRHGKTCCTIDRIGVVTEWREQGLASHLLDFALSTNTKLPWRTYIAAHNIASQALFVSRGFMPYQYYEMNKPPTGFIRFRKDVK